MSVSAEYRGAGIGTRLLAEIDTELDRQGITEVLARGARSQGAPENR